MMPVAVPAMVIPAYLYRLHLVDFALRHDRRFDVSHRRYGRRLARERRYGSSLCACSKHDRARDQSSTEIQEIPEFHDVMPLSRAEREDGQSHRPKMNVR